MGGDPKTALNIVGFPRGAMEIETLVEVLRGGADRVREAGAVVIGGHSIIDPEIKYGMAVTGTIHPDRIVRNVGARPGDALVLTKPLGTGIITTAAKRAGSGRLAQSLAAAVASMVTLNAIASRVMRGFDVHACSDVTGFSLLGHSQEMAAGSGVTIELDAPSLPLLDGAPDLAESGHLTGGCKRNRAYLQDKVSVDPAVRPGLVEVAFDPQTSGGLLIALPAAAAPRLAEALKAAGVQAAAVAGRVVEAQRVAVRLIP